MVMRSTRGGTWGWICRYILLFRFSFFTYHDHMMFMNSFFFWIIKHTVSQHNQAGSRRNGTEGKRMKSIWQKINDSVGVAFCGFGNPSFQLIFHVKSTLNYLFHFQIDFERTSTSDSKRTIIRAKAQLWYFCGLLYISRVLSYHLDRGVQVVTWMSWSLMTWINSDSFFASGLSAVLSTLLELAGSVNALKCLGLFAE